MEASRENGRTETPKMTFSLRIVQLRGKIRRLGLTTFRRGYVRAQMARREGECRRCGGCCRLAYRCLFLNGDNLCAIYKTPRLSNCKSFPIDERDLREVPGGCGYRFRNGRE